MSRLAQCRVPLASWAPARRDRPRIGFTGDVVVGQAAEAAVGDRAFAPALVRWAGDLAVLVVSFDATFPGGDPKPWRPLVFAGPRSLDALPRGRVTLFNLGNNHAFDGGSRGFDDLRAALAARGIDTVGAGRSRADAERPWTGEVGGVGVAIFAAAHHGCHPRPPLVDGGQVASVDSDSWWASIEAAARKDAFVVALIHGGVQGSQYPSPRAIQITRRLAALGVGAVVWTHAHAVQGVVAVGRTLAAYGLGNALHPPLAGVVTRPHADPSYDIGLLLELEPEAAAIQRASGLLVRREALTVCPLPTTAGRRRWFSQLCAAPLQRGYALRWRWHRLREDVLRPLAQRARDGSWRHARPRHAAALVARLANARADARDV